MSYLIFCWEVSRRVYPFLLVHIFLCVCERHVGNVEDLIWYLALLLLLLVVVVVVLVLLQNETINNMPWFIVDILGCNAVWVYHISATVTFHTYWQYKKGHTNSHSFFKNLSQYLSALGCLKLIGMKFSRRHFLSMFFTAFKLFRIAVSDWLKTLQRSTAENPPPTTTTAAAAFFPNTQTVLI